MCIYTYYYNYSSHEIDIALSSLSAFEYRTLIYIFEKRKNNGRFKFNKEEINLMVKFNNILENNRRNGITSLSELTLKIINLVNSGKCNKEICNELNIDYKTLYFELNKVKKIKRTYDREYFVDGTIIGKEITSNNKKNYFLNIGDMNELKFLVISDLHFGNSLENIDAVNRAFNYAKINGINIILACGDFIDGSFSKGKQIVERFFKQFEHFALDYPYDKYITTFGVGGNHDYSIKLKDDLDFIKFCKMYRDDVVVNNYANNILDIGKEKIQMSHEIKGFNKLISSSKIVLNGHKHRYTINYVKDREYLNIYVPTLSNLIQTVPEALELDLSFENDIIVNANVKEICFGNKDIILSENDFIFSGNDVKNGFKDQPKIKELEKRSSQIDKFNKRYGL